MLITLRHDTSKGAVSVTTADTSWCLYIASCWVWLWALEHTASPNSPHEFYSLLFKDIEKRLCFTPLKEQNEQAKNCQTWRKVRDQQDTFCKKKKSGKMYYVLIGKSTENVPWTQLQNLNCVFQQPASIRSVVWQKEICDNQLCGSKTKKCPGWYPARQNDPVVSIHKKINK